MFVGVDVWCVKDMFSVKTSPRGCFLCGFYGLCDTVCVNEHMGEVGTKSLE